MSGRWCRAGSARIGRGGVLGEVGEDCGVGGGGVVDDDQAPGVQRQLAGW